MSVEYDMTKLEQFTEFDAAEAVKGHSSQQHYFDELTKFTDDWSGYLRSYNPTVVLYSDDVRRDFLSDVAEIKKSAVSLKLTRVEEKLDHIIEAVDTISEKSLVDALWMLFATMEITANNISSAVVKDKAPEAGVFPDDKKAVILAVDDSPVILTSITEALSDLYTVVAVTSASHALKVLEKRSPDIFLLDIIMPDMDGFELAERIRQDERFKKSIIIFLTGITTREHVLKALELGGTDFIAKPANKAVLLKKLSANLKKSSR